MTANMRMFHNATVAELSKLVRRPAIWIIGVIWLLLGLLFGYVFPYISYRSGGTPTVGPPDQVLTNALPPHLAITAIQGMPMFVGALAVIMGALVGGSEYGWGTLKTLFTQRPGRATVLAGKVAGLANILFLLLLATFAVDAAAAAIVAGANGSPLDFPGAGELVLAFFAGWLMLGVWSAAGLALGVATRGTSLAIGLGLVWLLVIENLVRGFASLIGVIEALQGYLPGTNAGALVAALGGTPIGEPNATPGVTDVVGGTHATIVLAVYLAVAVIGSTLLVRRRDVA